ncbi:MAG: glycosyltransferase family 1 protein [Deltaproteobacteria bacterium]|nr:glycosyltransferase family 1 protein [Deltaproteobacteria bacterium]
MSASGHKRALKILHIDPERNWGGGEAQVLGLLKYLAAQGGHRNELVGHPNGKLFAACETLDVSRHGAVIRNDLDLRCIPKLRRLIRLGGFDIVHFHTKRAHALALWLPRGPRYVVTRRMDYPEARNWYTHCLYNKRVDGVVAISQNIAELLIAAGVNPQKIRTITSGIDVDKFALGRRTIQRTADEIVVGSMGVLEERKGHRFLLEAAAQLKTRGMNLQYRIAGDGAERQSLERLAAELGIADQVRFAGFVTDTAAFFAAIDLFVMPSLFEGLGVAVLEAMAAGKPVIATRVGGLVESVLDGVTGLLVEPKDASRLADAIERIVGDPELALTLGCKGAERARQHYTLEQMARRNEAYYYELLDGSGSDQTETR